MRQFVLIAMMLLSANLYIQAQQRLYTPGKTWIYHNKNTLMPIRDYYYKVSVVCDTVVNGVNATILCTEILDDDHETRKWVGYEDDGIIYEAVNGKLYPVMNFNLHLGDIFYLENPYPYYEGDADLEMGAIIISDEQTYCIEGIDRRVLTVKILGDEMVFCYWIEGIGTPNPDCSLTVQSIPTDGSVRYLSECYDGDRLIFSKTNFDKLVTGIDEVESDKRQCEAVYDLMGRRVTNPVKGHLYVTASKKKVW